jgi:hypothetical protein
MCKTLCWFIDEPIFEEKAPQERVWGEEVAVAS